MLTCGQLYAVICLKCCYRENKQLFVEERNLDCQALMCITRSHCVYERKKGEEQRDLSVERELENINAIED